MIHTPAAPHLHTSCTPAAHQLAQHSNWTINAARNNKNTALPTGSSPLPPTAPPGTPAARAPLQDKREVGQQAGEHGQLAAVSTASMLWSAQAACRGEQRPLGTGALALQTTASTGAALHHSTAEIAAHRGSTKSRPARPTAGTSRRGPAGCGTLGEGEGWIQGLKPGSLPEQALGAG